ncbi:hypothetical protein EVAR_51991_1 [Eumeta japonica]|uniref:Uncharacterized protein n=1 Tax=Eumeta variegata TaxID=151549 RepID=A0A4C1Y1P4_EUMVA|nr:hypothetical protein EVAR_51991_1 [Eumeta japonica]
MVLAAVRRVTPRVLLWPSATEAYCDGFTPPTQRVLSPPRQHDTRRFRGGVKCESVAPSGRDHRRPRTASAPPATALGSRRSKKSYAEKIGDVITKSKILSIRIRLACVKRLREVSNVRGRFPLSLSSSLTFTLSPQHYVLSLPKVSEVNSPLQPYYFLKGGQRITPLGSRVSMSDSDQLLPVSITSRTALFCLRWCRRRTSLTQIVSQISATTFELVKPVINRDKGWSFIMKVHPSSACRPSQCTGAHPRPLWVPADIDPPRLLHGAASLWLLLSPIIAIVYENRTLK